MEGGIASDWLLHPSLQGDLRLINCSQSRQQASRTGEWRAPMTQSGLGGSNKIVVAPPPPSDPVYCWPEVRTGCYGNHRSTAGWFQRKLFMIQVRFEGGPS